MQLYGRRSSINVQKVVWCLSELGLSEGRDYQRVDAGLHFNVVDTPEYRKLNPNGLVPTLVDGDFVLWESNAIVRYLAATLGANTLLPSDARHRADVERWMDWQSITFWATLRIAFLGLTRTPEAERNIDAIRKAYADATHHLTMVDAQLMLHPYVTQTGFTVADMVIGLSVHRWFGLAEQYPDVLGKRLQLPAVQAWYEKLATRPAFQSTIA